MSTVITAKITCPQKKPVLQYFKHTTHALSYVTELVANSPLPYDLNTQRSDFNKVGNYSILKAKCKISSKTAGKQGSNSTLKKKDRRDSWNSEKNCYMACQ